MRSAAGQLRAFASRQYQADEPGKKLSVSSIVPVTSLGMPSPETEADISCRLMSGPEPKLMVIIAPGATPSSRAASPLGEASRLAVPFMRASHIQAGM